MASTSLVFFPNARMDGGTDLEPGRPMMEHRSPSCHSPAPMLRGLIKTLRPKQWVKNIFVGVPLFFSGHLTETESLVRALAAFALFCLISSCVYVLNDVLDVEKDKAHPKKRLRPIPSGQLPLGVAKAFVAVGAPATIGAAYFLSPWVSAVVGAYFLQNLAYCFWVKRLPYLDVLSIALGFVLRVLAGALAIEVEPSSWLMICSALLAMFLGFGKRAHELATQEGSKTRPSLAGYHGPTLRWILHILAMVTAVAYGMYTQSPHVHQIFGDAPLVWTLPFPLIGILRFIHIVTTRHDAESPTEEMLRDPLFVGNFVAWLVTVGVVIYVT